MIQLLFLLKQTIQLLVLLARHAFVLLEQKGGNDSFCRRRVVAAHDHGHRQLDLGELTFVLFFVLVAVQLLGDRPCAGGFFTTGAQPHNTSFQATAASEVFSAQSSISARPLHRKRREAPRNDKSSLRHSENRCVTEKSTGRVYNDIIILCMGPGALGLISHVRVLLLCRALAQLENYFIRLRLLPESFHT